MSVTDHNNVLLIHFFVLDVSHELQLAIIAAGSQGVRLKSMCFSGRFLVINGHSGSLFNLLSKNK